MSEMDSPDTPDFTLALWATNLARPLNGLAAWAAMVEAQMIEAKARGADLLVMPEYAAEQWLSFAPAGLTLAEEVPWLASQAEAGLAAIAGLPAKHGLALLAGTMPVDCDEPPVYMDSPYVNRAHLLLPEGRVLHQDKLCLTPNEKNPEGWCLAPGERLEVFEWRGLRLVVVICLDIELPALAALVAPYLPDIVLVPSMTSQITGYRRVFACARARAVELQAAVGAVGVIGKASPNKEKATNVSGAAIYLPCEDSLGETGLVDEIPPAGAVEGPGPLLVGRIPVAELRRLREGAAEVWPGAWSAAHVHICLTEG
jgi:predicted amidohydrolase